MKKVLPLVFVMATALFAILQPIHVIADTYTSPAQQIRPNNGIITLPASAFADGKARHFEYKTPQGQRLRFFLVKSKDGSIKGAFDACEVCYHAHKGYVQTGHDMTCVNCGLKFKTENVGRRKGGCNPSPLKFTAQGDNIVITEKDLLTGLHYFN